MPIADLPQLVTKLTNALSRTVPVLFVGAGVGKRVGYPDWKSLLGILADVNAHPKEGVFVPFFGVPACTSTGVALLAMRTNSAILPMCGAWDEAKQKYIGVHGQMIFPSDTGDRQRDILETTAAFTSEVERLIRRFPDQWLWIHKRWKTRPPGEPKIY